MTQQQMFDFIPAKELKKTFEVFGHFYSICLRSGVRIDCRSVLEIVTTQSKPADADSLSKRLPDAIFIMMNPGSSSPLQKVNSIASEDMSGQLAISLVPTRPDTTQYQVMRVMQYCGWTHVRVLNISDIREPESQKFVARFNEIETQTGFTAHSLFANERTDELSRNLHKQPRAPIVCAWGVSSDLDPLIQRCLSKLSGMPGLVGLLKPKTVNKYFHPLPRLQIEKLKWVNDMVRHIGV